MNIIKYYYTMNIVKYNQDRLNNQVLCRCPRGVGESLTNAGERLVFHLFIRMIEEVEQQIKHLLTN